MLINILPVILLVAINSQTSWLNRVSSSLEKFTDDDEPIVLRAYPIYPMYELKRETTTAGTDVPSFGPQPSTDEEEDNKLDPENIDYEDKDRKPAMDIANWTYTEQEDWERFSAECGGQNQSPIDIITDITEKDDITEIFFEPSYEVCCRAMEIKNTGRSVELAINEGKGPIVTGPFVENEGYHFVQLHFHWSTEAEQGSEHAINGERFDMEMHFVHYNKKYSDFNEASTKPDGLVVLATLFKISESNNPALEDIVAKIDKVRCGGLRYELGARLNLLSLLPTNFAQYYQYQGSLTTPPCSETVTWVVFKDTQNIGRKQIEKFRSTYQDKKCTVEMGSVVRQLQPLNDRIIYSSTSSNNHYPKQLLQPNGLSRLEAIISSLGLGDQD